MTLALDTNIVVDVLRRTRPHLRDRLLEARAEGRPIVISAMVLNELAFGAFVSGQPDRQLARVDAFLSVYEIEPFTAEDALTSARIRAELQRKGASIGAFDTLIAGQALAREWTLVTANVRDFIRVEGLTLLDWSDPDTPRLYDRAERARWWSRSED